LKKKKGKKEKKERKGEKRREKEREKEKRFDLSRFPVYSFIFRLHIAIYRLSQTIDIFPPHPPKAPFCRTF